MQLRKVLFTNGMMGCYAITGPGQLYLIITDPGQLYLIITGPGQLYLIITVAIL